MRLTESDAGFLYSETASGPMQTASVALLDGELPFRDLYDGFAARIHLVPRFRQRLLWVPMNLAHPKWVDDPDFDLKHHIVEHRLPAGTSLDDAVDALVELNEGLMDRNRPLWKTFVVSGVPGHTLLLQQVHHAMIDGASAVHLSTVLYDFTPDAAPPPPPEAPWNPAPLPSEFDLISEALRENAQHFLRHNPVNTMTRDEASRTLMQQGVETMSRFFTRPAITAPWNAGMLGPKRKMRWITRPFSELRDVRRGLGGTVNDVVLTIISEAAARYLQQHDEAATGQHFRIMCPVNVRAEEDGGALGNRVSAIFPMLPAWPMDPTERLGLVCEETGRIKSAQEAQALTLMQESGLTLPPLALAPLQLIGTGMDPTQWMAQNPPPLPPQFGPRPPHYGFNFTCTNVPGVQVPQYVAGHEVLETAGIMMLGGTLGYGVAVTSYNQKMIFCLTGEPRLLPDLEFMVEQVESVYAELLEAARAKAGLAA
ncbi:MAG: wax ester/triacylglycerol synthase family O-acyltransferase [Pseudomonadales bacterium]